ncbi:DUF7139 domain-containing protein [Salinirarus marinus]|uniref:DUF7139 domain-containing protein n=1 Tax=Salinirarus marinus TaxID=3068310 RepID=UPI003C6C6C48
MSTDTPENVLFEWYERYIGDPETETDVYLGFALFFGGIGLGAVGVAVFLLSAVVSDPASPAFALREVAVVASAGGLPLLLLGVVVLLPGDQRMTYAAVGGLAICLVAVALFVAVYPMHWNVDRAADYSAQGVAIYAIGLVAVVGATGASLVGHQVERVAAPGGSAAASESGGGSGSAGTGSAGGTVSEEDVRRDIEEAMSGTDISWGGVEKREGRQLQLDTETVDDVDRTVLENAEATTTRAQGDNVDAAVSGLRRLQGRETETASSTGVDEQTSALTELRKQQQAEEVAERDEGFVDRARDLFSR